MVKKDKIFRCFPLYFCSLSNSLYITALTSASAYVSGETIVLKIVVNNRSHETVVEFNVELIRVSKSTEKFITKSWYLVDLIASFFHNYPRKSHITIRNIIQAIRLRQLLSAILKRVDASRLIIKYCMHTW